MPWSYLGPLPLQVQAQGSLLRPQGSLGHSELPSQCYEQSGNEQVSKQENVFLVCKLKILNKHLND